MLFIQDIRRELADKYANPLRPNVPKRDITKIQGFVIHGTDDPDSLTGTDVYATAKYHTTAPNHISPKGCPSIAYTYYIEHVDNSVVCWKCLDDTVVGWHAGDVIYRRNRWNEIYLGIVVDYKASEVMPDDKYKALVEITAIKCMQYGLRPLESVHFHRDILGSGFYYVDKNGAVTTKPGIKKYHKSCPGWNLHFDPFIADVESRAFELLDEFGLRAIPGKVPIIDTIRNKEEMWKPEIKDMIRGFQEANSINVTGILDEQTLDTINKKFSMNLFI